jgi:hypothetical protein
LLGPAHGPENGFHGYLSPSAQALMSALEAPFRVLPAFQWMAG